ncbi:right-handed parallel beta-helix repeat-containing protein [Patescibacteria group bacterium]
MLFLSPFVSFASGYDFYVDKSASEGGDGSKKDPFKTINEAIEEAESESSSVKVYIKDGKYDEVVVLNGAIRLYGESESGVVISGKITMSNGSHIEDLTVANVKNPIVIKSGSNVEIENCTIKNFKGIGVNLLPGTKRVTIINTNIKNGSGKGIYAQRGSLISLINNRIIGNSEEGVDIRSKISGEIRSNAIEDNGESGIEVIAGSADLYITQNTLKDNGASGISVQYYPTMTGKGYIKLTQNSIHHNAKYGIDCGIPQGGVPGLEYWKNSVGMEGNNIYSNRMNSINPYCNMSSQVAAEDESDENIILEKEIVDLSENNSSEKNGIQEKLVALTRAEIEKVNVIKDRELQQKKERERKIDELNFAIDNQGKIVDNILNEVTLIKRGGFIAEFVFGIDENSIDNYLVITRNSQRQLEQSEALLNEIHIDEGQESILRNKIEKDLENTEIQLEFLNYKKQHKGVLGWIGDIF